MLIFKRFKGINFIELIVAISIISILSLAAVPVFTYFMTNYRLSAAGDNLYYYLQYARSEAIKRNTNVYVSFTTGDTWCYGININSACDCALANSCLLGTVRYGAAQQTSLSTSGMSSNSFYFEGSRGAASASVTATFVQYGQSSPLISVLVGHLGGIQMCSTNIGGYAAC